MVCAYIALNDFMLKTFNAQSAISYAITVKVHRTDPQLGHAPLVTYLLNTTVHKVGIRDSRCITHYTVIKNAHLTGHWNR